MKRVRIYNSLFIDRPDETIQMANKAGANAISKTPPTTAYLFKEMMHNYRK